MPRHLLAFASLAAVALAACTASAQNGPAVVELSPEAVEPSAVAVEPSLTAGHSAEAEAPAPQALEREAAEPAHLRAVSCDVSSRRVDGGLLISARAFADSDFDGEYDLRIVQSGANSSEISQSGPISLSAGSAVTLGESAISVGRGSRVRATLTLRDAHGEICRRNFRL